MHSYPYSPRTIDEGADPPHLHKLAVALVLQPKPSPLQQPLPTPPLTSHTHVCVVALHAELQHLIKITQPSQQPAEAPKRTAPHAAAADTTVLPLPWAIHPDDGHA